MNFKKIDLGYSPEPNTTNLEPKMNGQDLITVFFLNPFTDKKIKETDRGQLEFINCKAWNYGPPNDEAFYGTFGGPNYKEMGFHLDELYEVKDLESEFINKNSELLQNPDLKHFIFFTKEGTLECVAEDVKFKLLLE